MYEINQDTVFLEVRDSMIGELSGAIRNWDFQTMLSRLREEINKIKLSGKGSHKVRHFSRHYLRMHNDRFKLVKQWLNGTLLMSDSDIRLVLSTLQKLEEGTLTVSDPPESSVRKPKSESTSCAPVDSNVGGGARRAIVNLMIGTLNNFVGISAEMKLKPEDVYDGDRMQVVSAVQNICSAMGINAQFTRLAEYNSVPVKPSEMKQLLKGKP